MIMFDMFGRETPKLGCMKSRLSGKRSGKKIKKAYSLFDLFRLVFPFFFSFVFLFVCLFVCF